MFTPLFHQYANKLLSYRVFEVHHAASLNFHNFRRKTFVIAFELSQLLAFIECFFHEVLTLKTKEFTEQTMKT